uniref:DNA replication licensing factor MCM7 n=1 Tax=Syphacia muris TaxID=451379 RepID=A0A0N5AEB1_9BILA
MTDKSHDFEKAKENILEFFSTFYYENDDGNKIFPYVDQIQKIAERQQVGLYVNLDDVFDHDPGLVDDIRQNAYRYHRLFADVADELIQQHLNGSQPPVRDALDAFIFQRVYMDQIQKESEAQAGTAAEAGNDIKKKYPPDLLRRFEVIFKDRSTEKCLSVRELKAFHVGRLVSISGVVIRATEVKPAASVITYTCDTCGCETYQPIKGPSFIPPLNCPSKDCIETKAHGRLQPQVRGSKFVKYQEIRVQETSDQVPVGGVPRAISVNVYGECTRSCSPGDEVQITGVLLPLVHNGFRQLIGGLSADCKTSVNLNDRFFKAIVTLAFGCGLLKRYFQSNGDYEIDGELTDEEINLIAQENFYDLLARSIAPEIYGHLDVKKSLLLALVGGVDKLANGMKIRGCINILLMGDPGVAKSQLLSYVDRLAMRSQYTTGRGSSGVGLTAAVMKDPVTGEMTLEGGALVLADQGICCIDEFDKMMDSDRTAIHEVMEQQTISIAKAGIMTTLNARVSVIAAANPAFGRYNSQRSIEQNDKPDKENDKSLAEHVTFVHMNLHEPEIEGVKPLSMETVRKYIAICKREQPVLDEKLKDRLVDVYVELRKEARTNKDSTYTSPRTLLALIRMSTALARLRLADRVNESDIEEAIRLLDACKTSLRSEQKMQRAQISPVERAFAVIRDLYEASKTIDTPGVLLETAITKCIGKGIPKETLEKCVEEYSANGVLMVDSKQRIIFTT